MSANYYYRCKDCKAEFLQDDAREVVLPGLPPEIEHFCPDCNSSNIQEFITAYCCVCEIHQVQDEGDMCNECYTDYREAMADKAKDDFFDR